MGWTSGWASSWTTGWDGLAVLWDGLDEFWDGFNELVGSVVLEPECMLGLSFSVFTKGCDVLS